MQKFTNLIYLFLLVFTFSSCTKESLSEQNNESAIIQTTSSNKIAFDCPEFENILTNNFGLTNYFGEHYPPFTNASKGKIDQVMACPLYGIESCDRVCGQTTIDFDVNYLIYGPWSSMPWVTGGVFTVAEQNDLANAAIDLAKSQAPFCPSTNIKMEPIAYDLYWDGLACCPNDYWVAVVVKYLAPCQHEAIEVLDN
ncbi:MAG: hypothetical protein AB8B69_14800 [Chitinophagales bacterium]